jgi:hypothetical protein
MWEFAWIGGHGMVKMRVQIWDLKTFEVSEDEKAVKRVKCRVVVVVTDTIVVIEQG